MAEATSEPVDPLTGAGLMEFLDAAIDKGWINVSSAKALKTTTQKVLEIEPGWEKLDLRSLDPDQLFERFRNIKRNTYSDGSLQVYRTRFRQAIDMHLARQRDDPDWKSYGPSSRGSSASKKPNGNGNDNAGRKARVTAAENSGDAKPSAAADIEPRTQDQAGQSRSGLMDFPFPLREDLDVYLRLPRDLTSEEADWLSGYIRSLAKRYEG